MIEINLYNFIYYVLLIDSVSAVLVAVFGQKWWKRTCFAFSKAFPATKGWTILYLAIVLFIGQILGAWPMNYFM